MNDLMTIGAATSPVLDYHWAGEAAGARRTVPPVRRVKGIGLPLAGVGTRLGAVGVVGVVDADQVQWDAFVRIPTAADRRIPPRWRPVRC